jgi:hypothetical protein
MNFFEVNREERHFGFLLMASILSYPDFRKCLFKRLNELTELALNPNGFDIYAEPAILRDYWNDCGDPKKYNEKLESKRLAMLKKFLSAAKIGSELIGNRVCWTGEVKKSKLLFPGRWKNEEINGFGLIKSRKLLRFKWLCNAKPDVMIQSKKNLLLIEIKVESKTSSANTRYDKIKRDKELVYNQENTQEDLIKFIWRFFDLEKVKRIDLNNEKDKTIGEPKVKLSWNEVKDCFIDYFEKSEIRGDLGLGLIKNHFENMPLKKTASTATLTE